MLAINAALLLVALWLNRNNIKMLALTIIVGVGVFIPVPAINFYLNCAIGEMCIFLLAYMLSTSASCAIRILSLQLVVAHWLGHYLNGYPIDSPYHTVVQYTEHLELFVCSMFSNPVVDKITERIKRCLN